uniref:Ubiquitin-activating enzyme E1 C-terminal domain-containing protein n=1 Tax=Octactis speculum TaxID=3111310 RepID=A0A7S2FCV2_9STRA
MAAEEGGQAITEDIMHAMADLLTTEVEARHGTDGDSRRLMAATLAVDLEVRGFLDGAISRKTVPDVQGCIEWAARFVKSHFVDDVETLLSEHPANELDEDGKVFWSSTRRRPRPPDLKHNSAVNLLLAAARQRAYLFGKDLTTAGTSDELSRAATVALLKHSDVTTHLKELATIGGISSFSEIIDDEFRTSSRGTDETARARVLALALLRIRSSDKGTEAEAAAAAAAADPLSPLVFEKDDDANGHVDLVTLASNIRADAYGLPQVDLLEAKRIAGNIVPAIATTTAVVSGLSCIELLKLSMRGDKGQKMDISNHRNAFLSLALPLFAFSEPVPAEAYMLGTSDTETFTVWDRIQVCLEGDGPVMRCVGDLVEAVKRAAGEGAQVDSLTYGDSLIYADFPPFDETLSTPLKDLFQQFANTPDFLSPFLDLEAAVTDDVGDDLDMPTIRLHRTAATMMLSQKGHDRTLEEKEETAAAAPGGGGTVMDRLRRVSRDMADSARGAKKQTSDRWGIVGGLKSPFQKR